jgi:hypothetical protein
MTIPLSRYEVRRQRDLRRKQKANYENLATIFDGVALVVGFWFFMALVKGEEFLLLGFLLLALATALLSAQTTKDMANSLFASDTPKMFIPKVFDFIESLRYPKSEGISSERRKQK